MIEKNVSDTEAGKSVSKLIDVSSVPKEGRYYANLFNDSELKALAEAIDGAVLEGLNIELKLRALNRDRIRVSGHIRAEVAQHCVVTLEPVKSNLDENISTEFWPEEQFLRWVNVSEDEKNDALAALKEVDPEPYFDMKIDLGQFIYETIVASIDPYPRQRDIEFDWGTSEFNTRGALKPEDSGPFSKLKSLTDTFKQDKSG